MRDAAADLNFEKAAQLRDEIKRLEETELLVADDPLARNTGIENTQAARKQKAKRGKGKASSGDTQASYFAKPDLDEMTVSRTEEKQVPEGWEPPRKTWLEDNRQGLSTDGAAHGKPTSRPSPRSSSGKPGQRGGFKANKWRK